MLSFLIRTLAMAGGVAGAMALSQYPEFTTQYTQRLAGQIDALETVAADFDATAARSGLTREAALAQMTGTAFLDDRRADMTRTFRRYEALSDSYAALAAASPVERMLMPHRLGDPETVAGTWENFVPALPLSLPGALAAGAGYLAGWSLVGGLLALLLRPLRRPRRLAPRPAAAPGRTEPPLTAPHEGRVEPPLRRPHF
ncbi:prolyl-tRNA synthetase [Oceanicola granulosus HTCC2516]|uniref:Prolyl-tRNA synthetase n=1 Tax=Oceanicola granulosus (strain ATCC BAA-861 / DSM 15982 / KCTC 12143 / HTCC2516) TaxID=314256 RepID=Q2CCM5_OCEGH|nr:DUF2937 family protein [Oceanicola granulosus]EAR50388.1 prolyl-tRNA synthetase [Oceanicola granulosus HTCC2516]